VNGVEEKRGVSVDSTIQKIVERGEETSLAVKAFCPCPNGKLHFLSDNGTFYSPLPKNGGGPADNSEVLEF